MRVRRLLTLGPSDEPLGVRLYLRPIGEQWAAMLVADDEPPPWPDELKGTALFGDTPEEAEEEALEYLGMCAERN